MFFFVLYRELVEKKPVSLNRTGIFLIPYEKHARGDSNLKPSDP